MAKAKTKKSNTVSDVKVVKKTASNKSEVKLARRITSPDRIIYSYVLFLTPIGKGYACFAFKSCGKNESVVVASYCNPNDRAKFSKARARAVGERRLLRPRKVEDGVPNVEPVKVNLSPDAKTADVIKAAVEAGINMPSWARKAWVRGSYYMTLANDSLNSDDLLNKMIEEREDEEAKALLLSLYKEQRSRAENRLVVMW